MKYKTEFKIGNRKISNSSNAYFIADIGANHDGNIDRAIELICLAKEAGADCAKFQHFEAKKIVSDYGFKALSKEQMSHQAAWEKSVTEIYDEYHFKREWNDQIIKACLEQNIEFMTTPYDFEALEEIYNHLNAIKIGSGDITYWPLLEDLANKQLPFLLATGASNLEEVVEAVDFLLERNSAICLMQCNTNYTGNLENFSFVNLNVLKLFASMYPGMPLGLSDHTPGHTTVLGAVSLGATVIEKHFTDDISRIGPDHHFALDPKSWREMVDRTKELEISLGDGIKRVEDNECDTVVVQRRAIRLNKDVQPGHLITRDDLSFLRPCPKHCYAPNKISEVLGKQVKHTLRRGHAFVKSDLS